MYNSSNVRMIGTCINTKWSECLIVTLLKNIRLLCKHYEYVGNILYYYGFHKIYFLISWYLGFQLIVAWFKIINV